MAILYLSMTLLFMQTVIIFLTKWILLDYVYIKLTTLSCYMTFLFLQLIIIDAFKLLIFLVATLISHFFLIISYLFYPNDNSGSIITPIYVPSLFFTFVIEIFDTITLSDTILNLLIFSANNFGSTAGGRGGVILSLCPCILKLDNG